jgi:transcriptional regulator with XRE-family HTH domain
MPDNSKKISGKVFCWVGSQKDLAEQLGISTGAMSRFASGERALPLNRFLQIVHILKPPVSEVEEVFGLYLDDLGISRSDMQIAFRSYSQTEMPDSLRGNTHRMIDKLDDKKLAALGPVLKLMSGGSTESFK